MESAFLPADWRHAFITPIFKKFDRCNPSNYRPISLTCSLCKVMESVIKDQMLSYLLTNSIITKSQHAFISKHSTTTNLLETIKDWSIELNCSNSVDTVYIDFAKAFDSISFNKLLYKLNYYGITGFLLNWIFSFLHNRTQCVAIDNTYSSVCDVLSGVPQGSVLGPMLFLLFINDIEYCNFNNSCVFKMFADDLKLYTTISGNLTSDILQKTLDAIYSWSVKWQLSINITKCSVLRLSNKTNNTANCQYFINGQCLSSATTVSDLGIITDNRLSFINHINDISSKAMQRVGVLFKGFVSRDLTLMRTAFVTYIRPILEYSSSVWSPTKKISH